MPTKSPPVKVGRPSAGTLNRTVRLRGEDVSVRPAVAPLIELLLANQGKVLTLERLGKKLKVKPMTVRYYMVDARIALTNAGYSLTTIKGKGVRLDESVGA